MKKQVMLREFCHARAGDKGDVSNIGVICYDRKHYEILKRELTVERVVEYFKGIVNGEVVRYELPEMAAVNFVMQNALDGGTTRSLRLDGYGKSLSAYMISMMIEVEEGEL